MVVPIFIYNTINKLKERNDKERKEEFWIWHTELKIIIISQMPYKLKHIKACGKKKKNTSSGY